MIYNEIKPSWINRFFILSRCLRRDKLGWLDCNSHSKKQYHSLERAILVKLEDRFNRNRLAFFFTQNFGWVSIDLRSPHFSTSVFGWILCQHKFWRLGWIFFLFIETTKLLYPSLLPCWYFYLCFATIVATGSWCQLHMFCNHCISPLGYLSLHKILWSCRCCSARKHFWSLCAAGETSEARFDERSVCTLFIYYNCCVAAQVRDQDLLLNIYRESYPYNSLKQRAQGIANKSYIFVIIILQVSWSLC